MANYRYIFCTCAIFFLFSILLEGEAWKIPKDYELLDEGESILKSALTSSSSSSDSSEPIQENVNDNVIEVEIGKNKIGQRLFPRFPAHIDKKLEMNRREKLFQTKPTVDEIVHRTLAWSNSLGIKTHLVNEKGELLSRPNISSIINSVMMSKSHIKKDLTEEEEKFDDFDYEEEESEEETEEEEENVELNEEAVQKILIKHKIIDQDEETSTSSEQDNNDTSTISTVDISSNSINIDDDERELSVDEHEEIINLGTRLFAFGEHTEEDVRIFYNEMLSFDESIDAEEDIEYDQAAMDWPVVVETLTPSTRQDIEEMFTESPHLATNNININIKPTESSMSNDESYWNYENKKSIDEDSGVVSVIQVFYPDAKIQMKAFAVGGFLSIGFCGIIFIMWKFSKKHKKLLKKSGGDGKILI